MADMLDLEAIGEQIAIHRRASALTQSEVAAQAGVARSTLAALERGKAAELGFNKVATILAVLGLDLTLTTANRGRPTFDQLREENARRAQGLER